MGIVSVKGDVYSYGIMLMEVFTRKKPYDDMFVAGLSLKSWVNESMPHTIMQVTDFNLLQHEEHQNIDITILISSIFQIAMSCCADLPEARINMIDVNASLNKIKIELLQVLR